MGDEKELDLIEKAHLAAQRLEEANKVQAELLKKQEAQFARMVLGGQSEVSKPETKPISEDEKLSIGMKNYFKGGEIERYLK